MSAVIEIQSLTPNDVEWLTQFIWEHWGAPLVVARGEKFLPHELAGFVAMRDEEIVGVVTYQVRGKVCEIITLNSLQPAQGIGSALTRAVVDIARQMACRRVWLITSNDNLDALRFYQKRGFELVAVHAHALEESRKLKPEIPLIGKDGIPLRDEIELELMLSTDEC